MRRRRLTVLVPLLAVLAATVLDAAPAASAGGGGCHRPATEGSGDTLALTEMCFSPTVLRVAPGSEVTIVNRDTIDHPLSRPGGQWFWDGLAGDATAVRMNEAGTYPFFCYAHPGMVGVVVVGDGRDTGSRVVEAAATGTDGAAAEAVPAAATAPDEAQAGQLPVAWLVLVALAALVGAVAGTRLIRQGSA